MLKRIAWVLDTYPSVSETFIARDIAALRARGLDIDIFALRAGEGAREIRRAGLLRPDWERTGSRLGESLRGEGYGHVHAGWASHPAEIARAAAAAARLSWSFSGHARDLWVDGADWPRKLERASFAHCCTRAGVEFLEQMAAPESHIVYAPHGLDPLEWPFEARAGKCASSAEPPLILGVGRLVSKKGWDVFIDALSVLAARSPESSWRAAIIGEGPEAGPLRRQLRTAGLDGRVLLRGALPVDAVRATMQRAAMLVFSGRRAGDGDRDGLPNVLLEAAALGLPIIATRAGSVQEFGADALWLCPPDEPAQLAALLEQSLRRPQELAPRAVAARRIVEERFDAARSIVPLAAALEGALQKESGKPA